jgi:hypothetical protein
MLEYLSFPNLEPIIEPKIYDLESVGYYAGITTNRSYNIAIGYNSYGRNVTGSHSGFFRTSQDIIEAEYTVLEPVLSRDIGYARIEPRLDLCGED